MDIGNLPSRDTEYNTTRSGQTLEQQLGKYQDQHHALHPRNTYRHNTICLHTIRIVATVPGDALRSFIHLARGGGIANCNARMGIVGEPDAVWAAGLEHRSLVNVDGGLLVDRHRDPVVVVEAWRS